MSIRPDETEPKLGSKIAEGDIIVFSGEPHKIRYLTPYTHPGVTKGAKGWRSASTGLGRDSWGITLEPQLTYEVMK